MRITIPLQLIELEAGNFHILVTGIFKDNVPANWVIDTGASKSVFDQNLRKYYVPLKDETEDIHSAGIAEEPLVTTIGKLKPFLLGEMKIEMNKVALLNLSHINKLYSKKVNMKICGLIGGDFLVKHQAIIDYQKKRLVLKNG